MYLYRVRIEKNIWRLPSFSKEELEFSFAVTKKKPKDKRQFLEALRSGNPQKAYQDKNVLAIFLVKGVEEQGWLKTLAWTEKSQVELLSDVSVESRHEGLNIFNVLREIENSFNLPRKDIEIKNEYYNLVRQPLNIFSDYIKKHLKNRQVVLNDLY